MNLLNHNHHSGVIMRTIASQITSDSSVAELFVQAQIKETSKLRGTGLCGGNSPVTDEFPAQKASSAEIVSIWWRHHDMTATEHITIRSYTHFMVYFVFILHKHRGNLGIFLWNLMPQICIYIFNIYIQNQWSPEFCQYIGSSGLNSGPVNEGDSPALTVDILRHMLSAHPVWTISAYGVQRWIVDKNKFTNLRLNIC